MVEHDLILGCPRHPATALSASWGCTLATRMSSLSAPLGPPQHGLRMADGGTGSGSHLGLLLSAPATLSSSWLMSCPRTRPEFCRCCAPCWLPVPSHPQHTHEHTHMCTNSERPPAAGLLCPYVMQGFDMQGWGHLEIIACLVPSRDLGDTIHFWSSPPRASAWSRVLTTRMVAETSGQPQQA